MRQTDVDMLVKLNINIKERILSEKGKNMVLAEEIDAVYYSRTDTFPGNGIKESLIDIENQNLKTTRKELETLYSIPYCTRMDYEIEF